MLLLDVSNIMYTGASARSYRFGEASEFTIKSIPYFFEKIAAYYKEDKNMIAVFEKVGKMPALSQSGGYKSGRNRNPQVEWEIASLQGLLEAIGFPTLYVEGQEADHVIANYCRLNHDKEDIFILSADQDLAANIRGDEYQTRMLSYSTVSYNIDKSNFKAITGVDYNFMNINKILLGCKSDRIKPLPEGRDIYNAYIRNLESLWKRKYGYNPKEQSASDFFDDVIIPYTEFDYFMTWYKTSAFYSPQMEREMYNRRGLIEGEVFDLPKVGTVDWKLYNDLVSVFNFSIVGEVKSVKGGVFSQDLYDTAVSILRKSQIRASNIFGDAKKPLDELEEVSDISNIIGIISAGGDL